MTATTLFVGTQKRPTAIRVDLLLLVAAVALALASPWLCRLPPKAMVDRDCGPFTIGRSAIGGCDFIP
jgi:hypothetical protein